MPGDGKPLPPEIQRQLEEQFRKNPSSLTRATGAPGAGANGSDIVVTGQRPRGAVVGDLPAERTFNQLDIRAFGADDIGALLEAIGPQVTSNFGRGDSGPVTLLNGRRVSDFFEIALICLCATCARAGGGDLAPPGKADSALSALFGA